MTLLLISSTRTLSQRLMTCSACSKGLLAPAGLREKGTAGTICRAQKVAGLHVL